MAPMQKPDRPAIVVEAGMLIMGQLVPITSPYIPGPGDSTSPAPAPLRPFLFRRRPGSGAPPSRALARIVGRLLRYGGQLNEHDRRRLLADRDLAAYWNSVAEAGEEGWREERTRLAQVQRHAAAAGDPADWLLALDSEAVKALLPTWRAWGRVIGEAGEQES